jgi:hypothetical protein
VDMAQNDPTDPEGLRGGLAAAMAAYSGKPRTPTVSDHTVYLDGSSYTGTRFENCTFIYGGGQLPFLVNNEYINCNWRLNGPASNTLDFMKFLISIGGAEIVLAGLGLEGLLDGQR